MPTLPANRSEDPLQSHRCTVEFGTEIAGLLISCDGLESKNEIVESRSMGSGGRDRPASRIPGKLSIDPLEIQLFVLKGDDFFEKWFKGIQDGKITSNTKDGAIKMYDSENAPVAEWSILSAWPSKLTYTDLDSSSNDALKLTVTLVYEGFSREL
ncbi:phage tail protein [Oscillochloris sp. ZM17-4]|uniref:phage tail protein n=1 Tax=Oscillochloris sp. ZM17-4 TaxID=2866714 RepID=UPI001C736221|nr:phage tail protein [Oscillochloris sp. ZM17-4]MBX0331313.1 phage tail protein [Oscillochloris sp. ZM17-4]